MERQPCPERIYDDLGVGFTMGTVMGGIFHYLKGAKNAPRGERLRGGFEAMRQRGPVIGGNFAVWGGLFSSFECLLMKMKGTEKEDMTIAVTSGALTGGLLAIRGGTGAIIRNAAFGGLFLALIEGCSHALQSFMMKQQIEQARRQMQLPPAPTDGAPLFRLQDFNKEFDFMPQ